MKIADECDGLLLLERFYRLNIAAAEDFQKVWQHLSPAPGAGELADLIQVLERLAVPPGDGAGLVAGLAGLLQRECGLTTLTEYLQGVAEADCRTPVLARSAAEKFVPVCAAGDPGLTAAFVRLYREIGPWGPWPLGQVTNGVLELLEISGPGVAGDFAAIVLAALAQGIEEKPLIRLVDKLVPGIRAMAPAKRPWQTAQLKRVMARDWELGTAYLFGLERGLRFLKEAALTEFVEAALQGENRGDRHRRFLGLEAIAARELNRSLQTMVPLSSQLAALHRYLKVRSGLPVSIRPLSELPSSPADFPRACCTDGRLIYLPAEMECGSDLAENRRLYRLLAGWELSLIEAGCFEFDFTAWREEHGARTGQEAFPDSLPETSPDPAFRYSDHHAFCALFPDPRLAERLFGLAEFIRVRAFIERFYPGFAGRLKELRRQAPEGAAAGTAAHFCARLLPDLARPVRGSAPADLRRLAAACDEAAACLKAAPADPKTSADWVAAIYPRIAAFPELAAALPGYRFPFARTLRFDLAYLARRKLEEQAHTWRERLAERGVKVEKGLLRALLADEESLLTPEMLRRLLEKSGRIRDREGKKLVKLPPGLDLSALFTAASGDQARSTLGEPVPTFWYDEWDFRLHDYLRRRVKLLEHRRIAGNPAFYHDALADHSALVRRIRRNFELIRPEAITILRHWPEGDAFDYDALIEYAIDRRLRRTPDERIYRKRLKVERDVAVFVLVDLSSSTRKEVGDGGGKSILAVEKEALVLFCEALERVGDHFAIAGFSGSGRLAAEFFCLKDFDESLNDEVRGRIGGLRPEKNTRMGPAVRHAARRLQDYPARVKLMIILSDGLPNDQDYSGDYAIADSRAAIRESRSAFIHVHAITVNAVNSPHLDTLYGDVNHTVIADVRQLPDKLPRIYRALTRN
jgi:Mg-chelatase subunit ChlD